MSVDEIKQKIATNNSKYQQTVSVLKNLREKIIAEIKPYAKKQIQEIVEANVQKKSAHTKELGLEALSEMKKKLNARLKTSDDIVDKTFADNSLWLHEDYHIGADEDSIKQKHDNGKKAIDNIHNGIKIILGEAGQLLIEYNYDKAEVWRERYATTWFILPNSQITYGFSLLLPQPLENLITQYSKELECLHDCIEKGEKLKNTLSEQEAVDLWNKA